MASMINLVEDDFTYFVSTDKLGWELLGRMCARLTSSKLSSPMTSCCCQGGPFSESLERRGSTEHTLSQNLLQRYRERERAELPSFLLSNDKYFCLFNQSSVGLSLSWSNTLVKCFIIWLYWFYSKSQDTVSCLFLPDRGRERKLLATNYCGEQCFFLYIFQIRVLWRKHFYPLSRFSIIVRNNVPIFYQAGFIVNWKLKVKWNILFVSSTLTVKSVCLSLQSQHVLANAEIMLYVHCNQIPIFPFFISPLLPLSPSSPHPLASLPCVVKSPPDSPPPLSSPDTKDPGRRVFQSTELSDPLRQSVWDPSPCVDIN